VKLQLSGAKKSDPIVMPKKGKGGMLTLGKKGDVVKATPSEPVKDETKESKETKAEEAKVEKGAEVKLTTEERREKARQEVIKKRQTEKKFTRDPRPHFSIVFCGHVDAGKSTLSGRLMHSYGLVDEREMDKIKRDASSNKREGWEYAYVFDVSEEERAKGKTHEVGAGYFETKERRITILDAPGHKAFVPSMIGGAVQAELAVLVISARTGEFEAGFDKGGQSREHTMLVRTCGVKNLICVVNKMDETEGCPWNKERYDQILEKLRPFFKGNGFDEKNGSLKFIPIAALANVNLLAKPEDETLIPWYNGPCLMDYVNGLNLVDTRREDDVLAIPLVGAVKDEGKMHICGKCESGSIEVGDKLQILPSKTEVIVETILIENTELDKCYPGDNVQLRVRGLADDSDVSSGFVLTSIPTSLRAVEYIQARVMVLDVKNILSKGSRLMMHIHTAQEEVVIDEILAIVDKKMGPDGKPVVLQKKPSCVKAGDTMMVRLEIERPLVVEEYTNFDKMARFMLREDGKTVALGFCTKLYESTKEQMRKTQK